MRKKRLLQLTAALLCAVILSACGGAPADADYTCTVSISCATILDQHGPVQSESKVDLVPADGCDPAAYRGGLLPRARAPSTCSSGCAGDNGIHLESEIYPRVQQRLYPGHPQSSTSSTWASCQAGCTAVNDWFPNYGCSLYQVQDGDVIRWVYTCDLGADVGGGQAAGDGQQEGAST